MTGHARILVVDDEPDLRLLLEDYLGTHGYAVRAVDSGGGLDRALGAEPADVIILDVNMPGEDGFTILARLRAAGSRAGIVMLTAAGAPEQRVAGLGAGADDYLPKPFEPRELLLRINALLRRVTPVQENARKPVHMGDAVYDPTASRLTRGGKPVKLTSSEAALLQLFAANAGHSFSRSDLCARLGVALERSIDVQVTRLRRKIEEDPKLPLYLQTVRGVGYVLVPDRNG